MRRRLQADANQVKSLLSSVREETARAILERQLDRLKHDIGVAQKAIEMAIRADEPLARKAARLRTAPGVGPVFAVELIASLPELGSLSSRQVASLVGVAPHPRQSGRSCRPGRCQGGRGRLRRILYMATLSVITRKGAMRPDYDRLRANGKPFKVAIVAMMRKLIVALNAMLKQGADWCHPAT